MSSPSITLLDLKTGTQYPCPLPSDHPYRYAVALGNFDGVHAAHRELISTAINTACQRTALGHPTRAAAWCFRTLSSDYFSASPRGHLTTLEEKLSLFAACGLSYVFLVDFPSVRTLLPSDFIDIILRQYCAVEAVCCGFNYHFGRDGQGDSAMLFGACGALCTVLPCYRMREDGELCWDECENAPIISSSEIRRLLQIGSCEFAAKMLRRPYMVTSVVEYGKQLGRTLGLPTANQTIPPSKLIPKYGVYASVCVIDGVRYFGVSNIGCRPTVDGENTRVNCETHFLDFKGDLYGKELCVYLLHKLRDEIKFSDVNALRTAILSDIQKARQYVESPAALQLLKMI